MAATHIGRMRKRHLERLREKRNLAARVDPGWKFRFTQPDEFVAVSDPIGHAEFDDGEGGSVQVDLLNCCHCGRPFGVKRHGMRSKCLRCDAMTCGSMECNECTGPNQQVRRFGKA